jgi:hypothetical protein
MPSIIRRVRTRLPVGWVNITPASSNARMTASILFPCIVCTPFSNLRTVARPMLARSAVLPRLRNNTRHRGPLDTPRARLGAVWCQAANSNATIARTAANNNNNTMMPDGGGTLVIAPSAAAWADS